MQKIFIIIISCLLSTLVFITTKTNRIYVYAEMKHSENVVVCYKKLNNEQVEKVVFHTWKQAAIQKIKFKMKDNIKEAEIIYNPQNIKIKKIKIVSGVIFYNVNSANIPNSVFIQIFVYRILFSSFVCFLLIFIFSNITKIRIPKLNPKIIAISLFIFYFGIPCISNFLKLDKFRLFILDGSVVNQTLPKYTNKSFLNKTFQKDFELYLNQNLPWNNLLTKFFNTIYYITFKKSYASNDALIIGKNNYLYEKNYIEKLQPNYNINETQIEAKFNKQAAELKYIQNWFLNQGKIFILIITPSKAVYEKDKIPKRFRIKEPNTQDFLYNKFVASLNKHNLIYVDTINYINQNKNNKPIFVQGGIHWNDYGKYLGTQALLETINKFSFEKLPALKIESTITNKTATGEDEDLAKLLNLLYIPKYNVEHLTLKRNRSNSSANVKMLSGSFGWGLTDMLNRANIFRNINFYFYCNNLTEFHDGKEYHDIKTNVKFNDIIQDMKKGDIIIVEINESILDNTENNNVEKLLENKDLLFN